MIVVLIGLVIFVFVLCIFFVLLVFIVVKSDMIYMVILLISFIVIVLILFIIYVVYDKKDILLKDIIYLELSDINKFIYLRVCGEYIINFDEKYIMN